MAYYKPKRRKMKKKYWIMRITSTGLFEKLMRFRRRGESLDLRGRLARQIAAHFGGDFITVVEEAK